MTDITKCKDSQCFRANTCYRATAKAGEFQYYFTESPRKFDNTCTEYWQDKSIAKDDAGDCY